MHCGVSAESPVGPEPDVSTDACRPLFSAGHMIYLLPRRQWKSSIVSYRLTVCTPSSSSLSFIALRAMSPPLIIAATVPIIFILLLINIWWDRHWKLRDLPTPVCCFLAPSFSNRTPTRRLVPLSSGATKNSSSKTTKALNGVPGSTNAVELSRSKPPGATQIS